jgi:hypothetical protein
MKLAASSAAVCLALAVAGCGSDQPKTLAQQATRVHDALASLPFDYRHYRVIRQPPGPARIVTGRAIDKSGAIVDFAVTIGSTGRMPPVRGGWSPIGPFTDDPVILNLGQHLSPGKVAEESHMQVKLDDALCIEFSGKVCPA